MINMISKNCKFIFVLIIFLFSNLLLSYGDDYSAESSKIDTLVTLRIIEDGGNLDTNVTRAEFSKIIVRASENREKVPDSISENVCNDVLYDTPYAPYIKDVLEKGYMFTYLGGIFKPNEYVSYNDLTRACLGLLTYDNNDFRGNQVIGRTQKFESLGLNKNINLTNNDFVKKIDIINAIYNTLKENVKDSNTLYGKKVFDKLIVNTDGELNATEYIQKNVKGPYVIKSFEELSNSYDISKYGLLINYIESEFNDLKDDLIYYGYAICYIDNDNNKIIAYTERPFAGSQVTVRKGYIYKIYYAASNMLIPYRVDIDNYKYMLESEEMKFAFSANGSFKEDDYIVYICNKNDNKEYDFKSSDGSVKRLGDESEPFDGSIITAFNKNILE